MSIDDMALAHQPNFTATAPAFERQDMSSRIRLSSSVKAELKKSETATVESRNGVTIAVAINVCEAMKWPYSLRADPLLGYTLKRLERPTGTPTELMARRADATERLACALAHLPPASALSVVAAYLDLRTVELLADAKEREFEKKDLPLKN